VTLRLVDDGTDVDALAEVTIAGRRIIRRTQTFIHALEGVEDMQNILTMTSSYILEMGTLVARYEQAENAYFTKLRGDENNHDKDVGTPDGEAVPS